MNESGGNIIKIKFFRNFRKRGKRKKNEFDILETIVFDQWLKKHQVRKKKSLLVLKKNIMAFESAWPTALNWIVTIGWITYVCLTNPWSSDHYDKYNNYRTNNRVSWLWHPPVWAYKVIWGLINAGVAAGAIIFTIQLNPLTDWYVSIMTLAIANIYMQKWFPVLYFEWHNYRNLGLLLSVGIWATAGAVAGLAGYRAFEENEDSVYASLGLWAAYFLWTSWMTILIFWTEFPTWCPQRGLFVHSSPAPMQGNMTAHAKMMMQGGNNGMGMYAEGKVHNGMGQQWNHGGQMMKQHNGQHGQHFQGNMTYKNW